MTQKSKGEVEGRQDVRLWVIGMAFIAFLLGMVHVVGNYRGWDAPSGFTHNESLTSKDRFLPEPFIPQPGVRGRYGPDAWAKWYYWQTFPDQRTFWTHFFPWCGYCLHQVFIWVVIYLAQADKASNSGAKPAYSTKTSRYNWIALGLNIFFHLLHFVNSHTTYDATAPDASIVSSQSSVAMLITFIYLIEYNERGLFLGWPSSKSNSSLKLDYGPVYFARRYHGYAFAWAAVYTFWYHPMENTLGHYMGFFHTWILLLQGSLMYTQLHLNKYWRLLLETWVTIHGALVAIQTGGPSLGGSLLWPMFLFGLSFCFVFTQIFTLPFWGKLPTWFRLVPGLLFSIVTIWTYSWLPEAQNRKWVRLNEVFRIPTMYYMFFMVAWGSLYLLGAKSKNISSSNYNKENSVGAKVFSLISFVFIYFFCVAIAIYCELGDVQYPLMALTFLFVFIYTCAASISFVVVDKHLHSLMSKPKIQ